MTWAKDKEMIIHLATFSDGEKLEFPTDRNANDKFIFNEAENLAKLNGIKSKLVMVNNIQHRPRGRPSNPNSMRSKRASRKLSK